MSASRQCVQAQCEANANLRCPLIGGASQDLAREAELRSDEIRPVGTSALDAKLRARSNRSRVKPGRGVMRREADRVRIEPGVHPHVLDAAMTGRERHGQGSHPEECEITSRNGHSMAEVVRHLRASNASLIALDGLPGAGKSTLAVRLSVLMGTRSVHLDDYLVRNSIDFTNHLKYGELRRALLVRPVVVEGVCILDVLDRVGLRPDQLLYLQAPCSARFLDASHPLVREVRAYIERARPADRATFVLERADSGQKSFGGRKRFQIGLAAFVSRNRSRLARVLASAGIVTLMMGALAVILGSSRQDESPFRIAGVEFSVPDIGMLTMLTSGLLIFLACSAHPSTGPRRSSSRR